MDVEIALAMKKRPIMKPYEQLEDIQHFEAMDNSEEALKDHLQKEGSYDEMKKQIMSPSTQPELLSCDPSIFTRENEDQQEVVACSSDVISTLFSSIPFEVISSYDLPNLNTKCNSQVEYSLECPTMEIFNAEDATSEKSNICSSKCNGKQPKSYEPVEYSTNEPIKFPSEETFSSLSASVFGTKELGCKYTKKQQTRKSPIQVNKGETIVEILKRPFIPIKIS
ncbi:unnamed protein product [Lactuca saligna]|uniref:Uncharacterized protein n=1 Tax=Lactuca saligna TaxID=75948 RepID=A0AA35Z5J7_LACSI|nr:unnamed protein product [Lactuca saligna]